MSKLTEKQHKYAEHRAAGVAKSQAARLAGYTGHNHDVQAAKLEKHPEIRKLIASLKKGSRTAEREQDGGDQKPKLKSNYKSPAEFMEDCMNNPKLADSVRWASAKELLPYKHARIGEKGKKDNDNDKAKTTTEGTKFKPKQPPRLMAVK